MKLKDGSSSFLKQYKDKNSNEKQKGSLQKSIQKKIDKLSKPRVIKRRNLLNEEALDQTYGSRRHSQQS